MLSLFLALAASAPSGSVPPSRAGEERAVLASVEALLQTFREADSAAMLRLVYPEGRVTANGVLESGTGLRRQSWKDFAARLKPGEEFDERMSEPEVEVDGDVAMVWAPFVVRVGGKLSNCGFDHFDLVRENGAWKVMNLTFSSRVTGCDGSE